MRKYWVQVPYPPFGGASGKLLWPKASVNMINWICFNHGMQEAIFQIKISQDKAFYSILKSYSLHCLAGSPQFNDGKRGFQPRWCSVRQHAHAWSHHYSCCISDEARCSGRSTTDWRRQLARHLVVFSKRHPTGIPQCAYRRTALHIHTENAVYLYSGPKLWRRAYFLSV